MFFEGKYAEKKMRIHMLFWYLCKQEPCNGEIIRRTFKNEILKQTFALPLLIDSRYFCAPFNTVLPLLRSSTTSANQFLRSFYFCASFFCASVAFVLKLLLISLNTMLPLLLRSCCCAPVHFFRSRSFLHSRFFYAPFNTTQYTVL